MMFVVPGLVQGFYCAKYPSVLMWNIALLGVLVIMRNRNKNDPKTEQLREEFYKMQDAISLHLTWEFNFYWLQTVQ